MARKTDAWSKPDLATTEESLEDLEDEEDADGKRCLICFELESASRKRLFFVPCTHAACESCVQLLRREAVCKDVKGVLCPYCRQAIEKYSNVKPARPALKKPAAPSQHLTSTRFRLVADKACPKGKPRVPAPFGWNGICSIGGLNDYVPPPNVTGADGPGLKPNRSEENLLDSFQGTLLKPTDNLLAMAETVSGSKQIHYNLTKSNVKNQKKLIRQLLEAIVPQAKRLATHHCGNYTLQRMMGFASQHQGEIVLGESGYTALVRSLCKDKSIPDIACHDKGTFVVQKMVHCIGASTELRLVMDSIQGKVAVMANSPNACFSLERIVEVCIVSISRPADRAPYTSPAEASKYLCSIALELCATRDLVFKASHAANYLTPMLLIECLRWSATEPRTTALLLSLARHAREFAAMGKWGKRFLQGLLSLDVPEVATAIIDCFIGEPERTRAGRFSSFALDGREFFYSCLGTPCVTDASRDLIVKDFLVAAEEDTFFLKQPPVLHAFCVGLSLLPPHMLKEHVDILKALGSWGPSLMKMVQGFQAEFCINPAGLAPPSQPPQQQQVAVGGRVGSIPAGLNGHPHSHPPPSSTAENFPPLGAPRTSPPSTAGAVNRSASASQRKEGNAEGRVVSSDSSGQGESQGEGLGQAREGHAGQGIEGKDSGVGAGGEEKKAGKEGSTADGLATETVAPPAVEASAAAETATATATATAAPTEAGTGGVEALTDQGRLREASGAARPTVNGAGQVQGTAEDTSEESPRASNGTASTSDDGRLVSRPSGEVRAASLSESGAQGLMGEDSQGRKPGQTRIREAPLLCASCSIEPACMVIVDCRHLTSCSTCASSLSLCPFCTGPVSELAQVSPSTVTPQNSTVTLATRPQQATGPHYQASGLPQKSQAIPSMPPGFGPKIATNAVQQSGNGIPVPHPSLAGQPGGSSTTHPAIGVQPWQAPSASSSSSYDAPTYGEGSRLSRNSSQDMHAQLSSHGLANGTGNTAGLVLSEPSGLSGGAPMAGSGLVPAPGLVSAGGLGPMFPLEASSGFGPFFHPARNTMPPSVESTGARGSGGYHGLGLGGDGPLVGQQQLQLPLQQQQQPPRPQQQQQQQQFSFSFDPFNPLPRATYPGAPGGSSFSGPQGGSQGAPPGYTMGAGSQLQASSDSAPATESYFEMNFPFLALHNDSSAMPSQQAPSESQPAKAVIRPAPYLPPGMMDW